MVLGDDKTKGSIESYRTALVSTSSTHTRSLRAILSEAFCDRARRDMKAVLYISAVLGSVMPKVLRKGEPGAVDMGLE